MNFPGEYEHKPRLVDILVAAGHSGRQFNAMGGYTKVGNHPPKEDAICHSTTDRPARAATAYSLPSMEMRRIIRDAQLRFPGESFVIEGALLPGCSGDEAWRATAADSRFTISRNGDRGSISCVEGGDACETLLVPLSTHWFAEFLRSVLLQQAYPILMEDAGAHRRVHCFGP